jgi:hypothetical protein
MADIEEYKIGIRCQDVQHGLRDVQASGPLIDLQNTLLIGKCATLSMHLKGLNYVEDIRALKYMAGELGITSFEFEPVLSELQTIDFIRIVKSEHGIKRIEITVPELRDGYEDLGRRWGDLKPTEIENKAINLIDCVSTIPVSLAKAKTTFRLTDKEIDIISEIGKQGTFLDIYTMPDGSEILYSPIAVDENPEKIYAFVKGHQDNAVAKLFTKIQSYQGIPEDEVGDDIVKEAILSGVLLSPTVTSSSGPKRFIFTPVIGFTEEEKIILDKSRAILACVRYGQKFASGTKIKWPRALLQSLLLKKRLTAHPELKDQYGLLVTKGLGRIEETTTGFFSFTLNDTKENMKALSFAIQMLEIGETQLPIVDEDKRQILIQNGSYRDPASSRTKYSRELKRTKTTNDEIIKIISQIGRGSIK